MELIYATVKVSKKDMASAQSTGIAVNKQIKGKLFLQRQK